MRTIEIKEINVSTKQGRLDWLDYKAKEDWKFLGETGMTVLFEKIDNKKHYIIMGKGYVNCGVTNPYNLNLEITDLEYRYNKIELKANKEDLEKFIAELIKDEASFKIIDYFEKDSEEHEIFKYGPNKMFKPKNL